MDKLANRTNDLTCDVGTAGFGHGAHLDWFDMLAANTDECNGMVEFVNVTTKLASNP